jgi:hypothetical protein
MDRSNSEVSIDKPHSSAMGLNSTNTVDAAGIETRTGCTILTIADSWGWEDERSHLLALQAKLNAYFAFIESGEIHAAYPASRDRKVVIDIVTRLPLSQAARELLRKAAAAGSELNVEVRHRQVDPSQPAGRED